MASQENPVYRFGGCVLEPAERRLTVAGNVVPLTPKVFDTLVLLVERAGHVVTKEELLSKLWPRGFVDESNLTKHVWLIRRALGEGDEGSPRFVATVPKVGYRFVAPVTAQSDASAGAHAATLLPPSAPAISPVIAAAVPPVPPQVQPATLAEPAAPRTSRRIPLLATMGIALVIAAGAAYLLHERTRPAAVAGRPGRSVALVGFNNLSRNPRDAWLAPALNEMLGAELGVADDVRVVPDELVRDGIADIPPPAAGGYSPQTLSELRRRLDADYIISGSYLVSGSAEDPPLRVDLSLQDTRTALPVVSVSRQAVLSGLLGLVNGEGTALRARLSAHVLDQDTLTRVANFQPPSLDVARQLGFALDALRHFDAARARDELLETIAQAPGYATAYSYLAEAWGALGYRDKALAAAEQAAQRAANLPQEQRLLIDAVVAEAHTDWPKAVTALRSLAQLRPLDLDDRLRLADAQISSGAAADAQQTLRELLRLAGAAEDARVELSAAQAAAVADDIKGSLEHATRALQKAEQHDATGLVADARLALGGAERLLNRNEQARDDFNTAIATYRVLRNPRKEAQARTQLAQTLENLNRQPQAREEYQRAMAIDQGIGDLAGQANVYRKLCSMLWLAGDRDGAQAAARHALELARETSDLLLQSWILQALATIKLDDAATDEVLGDYREVLALYQRTGHPAAWTLTNIADTQRMRGELTLAADTCAQAQAQAAQLSDPQFAIFSGFTCALIDADRGNPSRAAAGFEEVIRRVGTGGDNSYRDNALMMLAQLDMDQGRCSVARGRLEEARRGFAAAEERTGEADANAMLALAAQSLGDLKARDQALERARVLRESITSHQEVYVVDIALARLEPRGATPATTRADRLLRLAEDASRRNFLGWSLEAKLAAWELLLPRADPQGAALRSEIEASARKYGFGRVLQRLAYDDSHPAGADVAADRG